MRKVLVIVSVLLLAVIAGSVAFGAVTAYNQVQHDNACSRYHNALLATTATPGAATSVDSDYNILSAADRAEVRGDINTYNKALRKGDNPTEVLKLWHQYVAAYVPHAMAAQGC